MIIFCFTAKVKPTKRILSEIQANVIDNCNCEMIMNDYYLNFLLYSSNKLKKIRKIACVFFSVLTFCVRQIIY